MNILFICTHNRCRSILAESIAKHISAQGSQQLHAYSAGSHPEGMVHPMSLHYLRERNINTNGLKSQSWDDFSHADIDIAITVCDNAAGETCPLYLGGALKVHWPLPDPSKLEGEAQEDAFHQVIKVLEKRLLLADQFIQKNHATPSHARAQLQEKLIQLASTVSI